METLKPNKYKSTCEDCGDATLPVPQVTTYNFREKFGVIRTICAMHVAKRLETQTENEYIQQMADRFGGTL